MGPKWQASESATCQRIFCRWHILVTECHRMLELKEGELAGSIRHRRLHSCLLWWNNEASLRSTVESANWRTATVVAWRRWAHWHLERQLVSIHYDYLTSVMHKAMLEWISNFRRQKLVAAVKERHRQKCAGALKKAIRRWKVCILCDHRIAAKMLVAV